MIPVNEPLLDPTDIAAANEAISSGWISSAGKYIEEFESNWSAFCGVRHGIAVSNGTTALQVAVEAVGVAAGDEVILPSYTIISCAIAIVRMGAKPVFSRLFARYILYGCGANRKSCYFSNQSYHGGPHVWASCGYGPRYADCTEA